MDLHDHHANGSAELAMGKTKLARKKKQNRAAYEKRRQEKKQVCLWLDDGDHARLRKIADTLNSPISAVAAVSVLNCLRSFDESTIADYADLRSRLESISPQSDSASSASPTFRVYIEAMAMGTSEQRSAHAVVIHERREHAEREIAVNRRKINSESSEKSGVSSNAEMAPDLDVSYLGAELFEEK